MGRARTFVVDLYREVRRDRITGLAAELSFYAVLSIFPGLLLAAALIGWMDALLGHELASQTRSFVIGSIDRVLTDRGSGTVDAVDALFDNRSRGVVTGAALAAAWALSRGMAALHRAMEIARNAHDTRSWLRRRLIGLGLGIGTVLASTVGLAVVVAGPLLGAGGALADRLGLAAGYATFWALVRFPVAFVLLVCWAGTLIHIAPGERGSWKLDAIGGAATAAAWVASSAGFSTYLRVAAAGNEVFGILGGGIILLFWFYLLAIGLLLGAEVSDVLHANAARRGQ